MEASGDGRAETPKCSTRKRRRDRRETVTPIDSTGDAPSPPSRSAFSKHHDHRRPRSGSCDVEHRRIQSRDVLRVENAGRQEPQTIESVRRIGSNEPAVTSRARRQRRNQCVSQPCFERPAIC
jgi:hypothetical protein